ncbi:MAG: D-alanyl-D-alanine carboxypeptidase [Clostridium sp.]|nr:D-alanyl-D-alanine carboxypeptidase [Clostridium sp.]
MGKYTKKIIASLFIFTILISNIGIIHTNAYVSEVPQLNAQGVCLIDGYTGNVLYEKNSDVQFEPASTTKVMTAIITLENCSLTDKVTIGENPPYADGSSMGLQKDEVYTVEELLIGLLLPSANDAAEALAEYVGGSIENFAQMMTKKAHEIGALNTTFKNPSGLHEEGHLTTAHDLALILKCAAEYTDFVRISQIDEYYYENHPYSDGSERWAINGNNCAPYSSYANYNYPDYVYDNIFTGKTGWTDEANHTYVTAANKDSQYLIAAFLNADNKAEQYASVGPLFDWGFQNFITKKIVSVGDTLDNYVIVDDITIPLTSDRDIYYTFLSTDNLDPSITVDYENKDYSTQTINKGDILFENASLLVNGTTYTNLNLVSGGSRAYTTSEKIEEAVNSTSSNKIFIIALFIILIIIYFNIRRKMHYNKLRKKIRVKHRF